MVPNQHILGAQELWPVQFSGNANSCPQLDTA